MPREPQFTIERMQMHPGMWLVKVQVKGEGEVWHRFFGETEKRANARAELYMAERREMVKENA